MNFVSRHGVTLTQPVVEWGQKSKPEMNLDRGDKEILYQNLWAEK